MTAVDACLFVMLTWAKKKRATVPAELARYAEAISKGSSVKEALEMEAASKAN
jgi:hypothetical protein